MGTYDKIIEYKGWKTELPNEPFDLVIDLHNKLSTWILRQRIKASKTVVYDKKHLQRRMIVWNLSKKSISSTLALYAGVLRKLDLMGKVWNNLPQPKLMILVQDNPLGDMETGGRKLVALFPGAAHETKMYPINQWREVIQKTADRYVYLLLGSPAEAYLCRMLQEWCPENTIFGAGNYGLDQLIRIIAWCDLVLSNDSGPMHVAAALGMKQIALFGATHPRLGFSPINDSAIILCRNLECQPCSLHGGHSCHRKHFDCLKSISAEQISRALDSLS